MRSPLCAGWSIARTRATACSGPGRRGSARALLARSDEHLFDLRGVHRPGLAAAVLEDEAGRATEAVLLAERDVALQRRGGALRGVGGGGAPTDPGGPGPGVGRGPPVTVRQHPGKGNYVGG